MIFGNPVKQTYIRPPSAPKLAGSFRVTQDFGPTSLSVEPSLTWSGGEGISAGYYAHFHRGIDLGNAQCGAAVVAAQAGTVIVSYRYSGNGDQMIVIDHGNGWMSSYNHLAVRTVSKGAKVTKGQKIGEVGDTGNSTACHLHFSIKSNVPAGANYYSNSVGKMRDPWRFLAQNVTIRVNDSGINIRATAGSGSTLGAIYASTETDGTIRLKSNNTSLGAYSQQRKWGGTVTGASYTIGGVAGKTWEKIDLNGVWAYVATPLATKSAT